MGAMIFTTRSPVRAACDAFNDAQQAAFYDHGHSGYTGTIAEKPNYEIFDIPDGVDPDDVIDALCERSDRIIEWFDPKTGASLQSVFDSKWGPAVAFKDPSGDGWIFCGWASC